MDRLSTVSDEPTSDGVRADDQGVRLRVGGGGFAKALAAGVLMASGLAGTSVAMAAADTTPPPTPGSVSVEAEAGDVAGDVMVDGESALSGVSASRNAYVSSVARSGNGGIGIDARNAPGYVSWGTNRVPQGKKFAASRLWIRVDDRGAGESVDLFTISNSQNTRNFDFFVTGDTQRFKWDIHYSSNDESNFRVEYDRWYLVEVLLDFEGTEHTARVRIDGVDQGTIGSNGVDTNVRGIKLGAFAAKTHRQFYDDVTFDVADAPPGWLVPGAGGQSEHTIAWDAVVDDASGLHGYQVWRNGRWYAYVPPASTVFVDRNPVDGATYQLRAEDRAGNRSGWSSPVGADGVPGEPGNPDDTTPPPTPRGVTADRLNGGATVSWNAVVDGGGSGLHGYHVWRDGDWYGFVQPGTTRFVDPAPVACASYSIRVEDRAGNQSGWSSPVGCP